MTLYIQQLQQKIVANSIEQSKGRIEKWQPRRKPRRSQQRRKNKSWHGKVQNRGRAERPL